MGGCLGPRQRKQQVYIEVIESIHEQAQEMSFTNAQSVDIYLLMKQKLSKKGLLKKLIDNLISHRAKIYDSLNHNYQIVLQSSRIENKYAGLLIIDQIIEGIYQSLKMSSQNISMTDNNNIQGSDNYSSFSHNNNTNNNKRAQNKSFQKWLGESKTSKHNSKKFHMAMQANPLLREIDSRFDMIYFSLIIYLLENVPSMYSCVLKSINSYCLNKKSKFLCTQSVWTTIHFIMARIIKLQSIKENIFSYMLLLQNTKENFKQYQKPQDLKMFIDLWIREMLSKYIVKQQRERMNTSLDEMNKEKQQYIYEPQQQQQQSQTIASRSQQQYLTNLIKIISMYFHTNISTWNSNFLYDVILDIYDQHMFETERVLKFESVIFAIILKNQLHVQFFRGLFLLLLDYLGYRHCIRGSRVQSSVSLQGGEVNEIKWANCDKKQVKFNGLRTLRRWVVNRHIDLNQTVSYNCRLLFQAYLTNYILNDTQYNIQVSKQFLKLIRQNLSLKSKKIVINTIIESIREEETDSRIRTVLIGLLRELLQDKVLLSDGDGEGDAMDRMQGSEEYGNEGVMISKDSAVAMDVIITIDEYYSNQNKLELIQLMGFVIQSLPLTYFNFEPDTININPTSTSTIINTSNSSLYMTTFKHKLSQFIYSCYHTLAQSEQNDLLFMLRFTCSVISFIKEIYINKNSSLGIVYAFYRQLVKTFIHNANIINRTGVTNIKDNKSHQLQLSSQQQSMTINSANNSIKKSPTLPQFQFIISYNTSVNRYFRLYLTYQLAHLLHESIIIPKQFLLINQKISSSQTVTHGLMTTSKSINHNKKQQIYIMINKLLQQEIYSASLIQKLKQELGYKKIEEHLQQHILAERENYQQTQSILSSYFDNYCQKSKRNISTRQEDNDQFLCRLSGNVNNSGNNNRTGTANNLFGRKDSVFIESENGSFYRQEDKNLKEVLSIINC